MSSSRLLLERLGADAWPALEQQEVDGWRMRASYGVTRRANSALPLSDALPVGDVVAFYRSRDLPPLVQVSDNRTDAALAALGWQRDISVDVLSGATPTGPSSAHVHAEASAEWLECWWEVDGRGGPRELEVARRMLARVAAPAAYAAVVETGRVVAVGRAVAHEGHLGVFSMAVRPEARRRGLARQVLHALGAWGLAHDATTTYLQVLEGNPALVLYAQEGLATSHRYHYRALP